MNTPLYYEDRQFVMRIKGDRFSYLARHIRAALPDAPEQLRLSGTAIDNTLPRRDIAQRTISITIGS